MKILKTLSLLILSVVALVSFSSCGDNKPDPEVLIRVSAETIKADGKATVTFYVDYDGSAVTSASTITNVTDASNPVVINGNKFSTTTVGVYKFTATYNGKTSKEITVTATSVEFLVDKSTIYNNGEVATFTILYEGTDVTAQSVITNVTSKEVWSKGVNTFNSLKTGAFTFIAKYNNSESSEITVTVEKAPVSKLRLASSKGRIKPDGSESTVFTVLYDGTDVTSSAVVKNVATGLEVENKTFSYTGSDKQVAFVAEYDGKISPVLNIGFGEFYKRAHIVKYTGTWCGPCGIFNQSYKEAFKIYPDRANVVAAHVDDALAISNIAELKKIYDSGAGIPKAFYDLDATQPHDGAYSYDKVIGKLKECKNKGAGAGIAAVSTINDNTLSITVRVTASIAREYFLGVMLVEDGITGYAQTNDPDGLGTKYKHDYTLRTLGPSVTGESLGEMSENAQVEKTFTFDLTGFNKENCNVVCYVNYKSGNSNITTNVATCPAGNWIDYRFEE